MKISERESQGNEEEKEEASREKDKKRVKKMY